MKKSYIIVATTFFLLLFTIPRPASAWLDGWSYCVDLTTDQSYNDHRYLVLLNDEDFDYGHAQAGGEDYRVVNDSCAGGGIEMDMWLENITATNSTFWFKGDNETNTDYALYYGNAAATSVSSGDATFGNFIDNTTTADWTVDGCTVAVDTIDNTYLNISCTGGGLRDAYRTENTPYGVYAVEWQLFQLSGGPDDFPDFRISDGGADIPFIRWLAPRAHDQTIWSYGWGAAGALDWVESIDRVIKFIINESDTTAGMSYYVQDMERNTLTSAENIGDTDGNPTDADLFWLRQQNRPTGITFKQRWIFWRPYVSPEPTVAIGAEEEPAQFAPEWFNNLTNIVSPATYSTDNYGFQVNWTDDQDANGYNFSYFEHNFTGVMTNYSTSGNENISYYNQTEGIPAGSYVFRFYANDSADSWNATDEWTFIVNKVVTATNLLLNGTDGDRVYNRSDTANFTVIIDVDGLTAKLSSNYTGFATQSGVTPLVNYTILDRLGIAWNMTGYFDGNQNYSASSETHYFDVILPPTLEPEFGISIAFIEERRRGWWGWLWNIYEDVLRFGFIIGNLKMGGYNITDGGFVLMNNTFVPAYIFHHVNTSIPVDTAGLFYNVTFNETCVLGMGINHTHDDATNDTFTILDDGVYRVTYTMTFQDSAPAPNAHIASRIVKNEIEVEGSLLEVDTSKQNADTLISHTSTIVQLYIDDEIQFQFTSDDTTVSLDSHVTFGVHKDSAVVSFERIA